MPYPTKQAHFGDAVFDLTDDVYEPAEDTFLFAENLDVPEGVAVLDVGAGCGILGILAAKKAGNVVSVDLNPYAIRCAKANAVLNHVRGKMDFLQASLFSALSRDACFDLILFNAPYLPSEEGEEASWIERSWAGGTNGRLVVDLFISEVPFYLKPRGRVLLMQSTLTGVEETIRLFGEHGLVAVVKAERELPFFETLTLIEAAAGN
jgi:release factor glutamine methyltransferase